MTDKIRENWDEDELPTSTYKPGDLGRIITPGLQELIDHRAPEAEKDRLTKFLTWCPKDVLEGFLVRCLEYGADKAFPKNGKPKTVRKTAPG